MMGRHAVSKHAYCHHVWPAWKCHLRFHSWGGEMGRRRGEDNPIHQTRTHPSNNHGSFLPLLSFSRMAEKPHMQRSLPATKRKRKSHSPCRAKRKTCIPAACELHRLQKHTQQLQQLTPAMKSHPVVLHGGRILTPHSIPSDGIQTDK